MPARARLVANQQFPARLHAVVPRPIENRDLELLRLEFELFHELAGELRSQGQIVSQDVVVGDPLRLANDRDVRRYFVALRGSGSIDDPRRWRATAERRPWVQITFGPRNDATHRNYFDQIAPYDASGRSVVESPDDLAAPRATVREAARQLRKSDSTVIRKLNELEATYGTWLVERTAGRHRRINLALLRQFF